MSGLVNHLGRPLAQERLSTPSRDSGSMRGSISGYRPRRVGTQAGETAERHLTQDRAQDLYANDFAARSLVDSIATNAVGTGLTPQPLIPWKRLGITEEQAADVKDQMEWIWAEWCPQADVAGRMHFEDLQFSGLCSILRMGEKIHVPVMDDPTPQNGRSFSLALQALSPKRLGTPTDKQHDPTIRDGVHLSEYGRPLGHWVSAPKPSAWAAPASSLTSDQYRYIPARIGHRPGIFHLFRQDEEEQVRGVSCLSTGVKLFRNLGDAIDHELLAQVLAASFPIFIAQEGGRSGLPDAVMEQYNLAEPRDEGGARYYQNVDPGSMMYANKDD